METPYQDTSEKYFEFLLELYGPQANIYQETHSNGQTRLRRRPNGIHGLGAFISQQDALTLLESARADFRKRLFTGSRESRTPYPEIPTNPKPDTSKRGYNLKR